MSLELCQVSLYTHCCRASPGLQLGFLVFDLIQGRFLSALKFLTSGRLALCYLNI